MNESYVTCPTCMDYAEERRPVLIPAIREHCDRTNESPHGALDRYMTGVHRRHLAGLPIMPSAS